MLCERCKKNNASLFYKETVNGKTTTMSLCHECAKALESEGKLSLSSPFADNFPHFGDIDDLFSGFFAPAKKNAVVSAQKQCSLCASTFADIVKNGKVGCAECYKTFRDELGKSIRSIHGNVKHIGRVTGPEKEKNEKKKRLAALKKELRSAIDSQEFERAAELRDEIKKLEGEN